ncbi:MAG: polysaccharide deacetylase family protein, partial [Clostridia bacterium]|nr:polysaccharide deacetylase family protein [Clostridia bacterium]
GYDDGTVSDRRLVETFDKYGIKGTFFLNSSKFDTDGFISSGEIKALYKNHEVAVHTLNHPPLNAIPFPTVSQEVVCDRLNIEKLCGYVVRGMSYPYGSYTDEITSAIRSCGISYCRKGARTMDFAIPQDFMHWEPTGHHRYAPEIAEKFLNRANNTNFLAAGVCYIYGHSYEFDSENNWYLIEDFCKTVSGLDGVWYATNIEIYDYLTAQKSLHVAADESFVYNPTQIDVWITKDKECVKIPAGETIYF